MERAWRGGEATRPGHVCTVEEHEEVHARLQHFFPRSPARALLCQGTALYRTLSSRASRLGRLFQKLAVSLCRVAVASFNVNMKMKGRVS